MFSTILTFFFVSRDFAHIGLGSSPVSATESYIHLNSVSFSKAQASTYEDKRTLLYLPGLDGYGGFSTEAFGNSLDHYDVWKMSINSDDRSSFTSLAFKVIQFLELQTGPVILLGESFGGLLACYVALKKPDRVSELVLVNPATSFDRSPWPIFGKLIANTGNFYGVIGTLVLSTTVIDARKIRERGQKIIDRIVTLEDAILELNEIANYPKKLSVYFPASTLSWRLKHWLSVGNFLMRKKYPDIEVPTTLLIGTRDRLLPSYEEGKRLNTLITKRNIRLIEFEKGGHVILDGSESLAEVFSRIPNKRSLD